MIRVVLAVALATALFGIAFPNVEAADRERNTALAVGEIESIDTTAARLVAENDPVEPGQTPAGTTVVVDVPNPTFAGGGRIHLREGELRWEPTSGRNHTVEPSVPFRLEEPIVVTDRIRLRLSFVRLDGRAVVFGRAEDSCSTPLPESCR